MTLTSPEQFVRLADRLSEFDSDAIHFLPSDDSKKVIVQSSDIKADIAKLRLSPKKVTERLQHEWNYCIYALPKGLAFIDIDVLKDGSGTLTLSDTQLAELISELDTFTVMSRNGGYHFYLHSDTGVSTNSHIHVNATTVGEYRTNWQYVVGAGSYVQKDQNATPNATGLYTIIVDKPIRRLSETIFPPWLKIEQQQKVQDCKSPSKNITGATLDCQKSDDEIIQEASSAKNGKKFQTLWSGDWHGIEPKINTQSEADMALCCLLAYRTQDPVQIERLFRKSGLYREKWDREDYSGRTIDKAIKFVKKPSEPTPQTNHSAQPNVIEEPVLQANPRMIKPDLPNNFVTRYIDFMGNRSDSYAEYQHASALTLLALIVNKHAWIELNIGMIYPNLWTFILGQSTISRKTTACSMVEKLTRESREWTILSNPGSPEAFIEDLEGVDRVDITENRSHGVMIRDEAAGFLHEMEKTYMSEMRDLLCKLYDSQPFSRKLRTGHKKSKTFFSLSDPYLNLFLATTPENFERYTTHLDLSSGWLLRFLFYYPNYERPLRDISSLSELDHEDYRKIKSWLQSLADLFDMKNVIFSLSENGLAKYNKWIHTHQENMQKYHEEDRGLFDRLSIYAIKIAILLTIGEKDFLKIAQVKEGDTITMPIDDACLAEAMREINEYFLPMAQIVITNIGRNEDRNIMDKVVGTLRRHNKKLNRSNLIRYTHLKKRDLDEAVDSLVEANEIVQTSVSGNIVYCLV